VAGSKIRDRLFSETDNNVTLKIAPDAEDREKTIVFARGELQLGILIEQMRREGFEILVLPPKILTSTCPTTGKLLEPFEEVVVDVDSEYAGAVVSSLTGDRKGVLTEMSESADGKSRLVLEVPTRGLLGFHNEIATATKGSAVVTHLFLEHRPHVGSLGSGLEKSKLVSNGEGKATAYALSSLAARGTLFIAPGDDVYSGVRLYV
jgi:GTP-binding protein